MARALEQADTKTMKCVVCGKSVQVDVDIPDDERILCIEHFMMDSDKEQ